MKRLNKEQRRSLREWIVAKNMYQKLGATRIADDDTIVHLLDRWSQRGEQLDAKLDKLGVDPFEFTDSRWVPGVETGRYVSQEIQFAEVFELEDVA